jgi:hypothetical protein
MEAELREAKKQRLELQKLAKRIKLTSSKESSGAE